MRIIHFGMVLLISVNYSFACSGGGGYMSNKSLIDIAQTFKWRRNVSNKEIITYMNKKYGINQWQMDHGKYNYLAHTDRPEININRHYQAMEFDIVYEKQDYTNRRYEYASKAQFFVRYKNLNLAVKKVGIPKPDVVYDWETLHRLWLVKKYVNKSGKLEILLDKLPWEFYSANCGQGSGVVSARQ